MRQLAKFAIEVRINDFVLRLTDEEGEVTEFASSAEQLEEVIDAFDDLMTESDTDEA